MPCYAVTHVPEQVFPLALRSLATATSPVAVSHQAESFVILLFENEGKKNPQMWGNPQGKTCFDGREACGNSEGRVSQKEVFSAAEVKA